MAFRAALFAAIAFIFAGCTSRDGERICKILRDAPAYVDRNYTAEEKRELKRKCKENFGVEF